MTDFKALIARSHAYLVNSYTKRIIQAQEQYKDQDLPLEVVADLAEAVDYLGQHNIPIPGRD